MPGGEGAPLNLSPLILSLSDLGHPDPGGGVAVHASAVAVAGRAVLVFGPSGSGKSRLALALMAFGAGLVSDDRVIVSPGPLVAAPPGAPALIEARGIGVLPASLAPDPVPLALAVDLSRSEPDRLPPSRVLDCFGDKVPLILGAGHPDIAPAILHQLREGA